MVHLNVPTGAVADRAVVPPERHAGRRRHRVVAAVAGFMAFWGYAGALGVLGGGLDFGRTITARLPFGSTLVAGIALLLAVAVPMTTAAVAAWRGSRRAGPLLLVAGLALVVWIAVEVAFIRTYSWMQPACGVYGVLVAWLGWRLRRR